MSDEFVATNAELHEQIGLFTTFAGDGPASKPANEIAVTCALSDDELDRKRRALGQHASQTAALATLMGEDTYRTWWRTEWFRRPTPFEIEPVNERDPMTPPDTLTSTPSPASEARARRHAVTGHTFGAVAR